jgi:hypothetical protein
MSKRDYEIVVRKDSTIPEGRARTLKRMAKILAHFPNDVSDRANCFFYGLTKGVFRVSSGQQSLRRFARHLPR